MEFKGKLRRAVGDRLGLCVGLDPVLERLPDAVRSSPTPIADFNRAIIDATADYTAAYKPNIAFYEALGEPGIRQLVLTIQAVPDGKVIIVDAKRGDIGSTAEAYAQALFAGLNADAVTVNPYLGGDSLEPFLKDPQRGAFVVALTTNRGGADLQELVADGVPVYRHVVRLARRVNRNGNVGLVMGATRPQRWGELLEEAVDLPLLVPGVGAQGGDVAALKNALAGYPAPTLVNASRSIIYASNGDDFAAAAGEAARRLAGELN